MKLIIASVAMLSAAVVAVSGVSGNRKRKVKVDRRMKVAFVVLIFLTMVVLVDVVVSGRNLSLNVVSMDLLPSTVALWFLSSSWPCYDMLKWGMMAMGVSSVLVLAFHLCRMFVPFDLPLEGLSVKLVSFAVLLLIAAFLYGLMLRMRNVKELMKNGTVWAVVCQTVDVVYFCFIVMGTAFVQVGIAEIGVVFIGGVAVASGHRIFTDSKFMVWRKQETLIIESMKLTSLASSSDQANIEDIYKEIYERVVSYFETRKPYLSSELTINELTKEVYSNKMYISKAISQFTGRNFCQFVNYYRVRHAMEAFRKNPETRVNELAMMSGFNSVVSFTMAFRLFMGETPSEWCRKEKSRLIKKGK